MNVPENLITVGKVSTVYGVKGWVKLYSYTEPMTNLLDYPELYLEGSAGWQRVEFIDGRQHGNTLVGHIKGVDDREIARQYVGRALAIKREEMPVLPDNEFYWYQLEGLKVRCQSPEGALLGQVDHLMATGANDVLVVKPCEGSIDQRERLLPYVPDLYVKEVNLQSGRIVVDWDPEF